MEHNEKKLKNMLSDRAKYHKKFQKGMSPFCSLTGEPISALSEDVSFEGKAMFCPSCGHRTLFFDNIHHLWSCSDCRKNYKYLVKNNHIEFIPEEYDMKLNKTKLKEEFVGKPEVGKTYWFKHSGGIRSGEFTRQTTSLNCFYVPEVDREVCIPIWANIATSREDMEGIEGVVDKMARDTQLPRYMVKDNPVKNPYPPKNRYDEGITKFPGRAQLIGALKTFDKNGKVSTRGNWRIANGGYDLAFEVYYNNTPVAQGYSDGTLTTDFDTTEFGFSKSELRDAITSVYSDMKTGETLTEAPDMFGVMTDDELDADEAERRAQFERELADRRRVATDRRAQWQQHKPAYDDAVKRFQDTAGTLLKQLASKFESGKLLQWHSYDARIVEIYKQYGNDKIVFKPTGDNKKNWLDTIVYSLSTGKVNFNYYKDDIGRYLDAYDQLAKLIDNYTSIVAEFVDFVEDNNKQDTDMAIRRFLGDFVDKPSNIDCAYDCSNPGHYAHGGRYYIFSVDGKVYHYEDYDSGAYTNNHVHQIRCFDRIDIKDYMWDESNPILNKVDPSSVGLSVKGDLYSTQYLLGGVVRLSDLTSGRGTPTDKAVRLGYYTSPDKVRHSVYFHSNERDAMKALQQLAKLVPEGSMQVNVAGQTSETAAKKKGFNLIESKRCNNTKSNPINEKKKKKKPYDSINYNAGNVEHNISMFNKMNNPIAQPIANPVNGDIGGEGCCEALEDRKREMREGMRLTNGMKEDESLYFDDGDYSYHIFRRTSFGSNAETEWAVLVVDYGLRFHHDKMYKDEKTGIDTVPVDVVHDKPKKIAYFEFTDETLPEAANAFLDEDGKKFVEVIKAEAQKHIEITEDLDTDATPNDVITEIGKQELRDFLTGIICEREDDLALEFGEDDRLWDEFFEANLESYTDKYREDIIKHFSLITKEDK